MLCNMKMSLMLDFWHRDVGPGPHCSWLGEFFVGVRGVGGSGWGDLITFLIVRSWWFICMKWQTCSYACHCLGKVWGVGGCDNVLDSMLQMVHVHEVTIYLFFMKWHMCCCTVHSSWYMSWYFCGYALHISCAWSDIRVATLRTLRCNELILLLLRSWWFLYVKWHKCWYVFHSWGFIYFAYFSHKRTW